jgi:hypothetical protein
MFHSKFKKFPSSDNHYVLAISSTMVVGRSSSVIVIIILCQWCLRRHLCPHPVP